MPEVWSLTLDPLTLVIIGVAIGTYALRLGGLLLAERLPRRGAIAAGLERLPGIVLLALVVPAVADLGLAGLAAAALTAVTALATRNPLIAMIVGAGAIAGLRALGWA
ncbi:AzlD domain-containing protein [Caenispirillum salinarum]|uniref:AzlD domain-containing protein n=1 Tax=Caenispirillum salinarum TaxID=859058 RepID=UPI00384E0256